MGLQTAGLCYAHPLNNSSFTACEYSFWDEPFLSRLYQIYLSIKDLEILAEFRLSQLLHLCKQKSDCATNFGTFGEIGANFPVQLSSWSHFAKMENKKVIAENQCEKHKKLEFSILFAGHRQTVPTQIRCRSCAVWSGSPLLAYRMLYWNKNKNEKYQPTPRKMEMDWSNW